VAVPHEAIAQTPRGAAAFVRFFYEQVSKAYAQADGSNLIVLSDPGCGTCAQYRRAADSYGVKGQHIEGEAVRILSVEAPPIVNGFDLVSVVFDAPARSIVASDGRVIERLPRDPVVHKTVIVRAVAGGWVVRAVQAAK
jgi:hypothetical protein